MTSLDVSDDVLIALGALVEASRRHGRGDAFLVGALKDLETSLEERSPRGDGLSTEQAAYLTDSGAFASDELEAIEASVRSGTLERAVRETRVATLRDAFSASEVASLLGIDASRVRHRHAKGHLFAFLAGGKRWYPRWQFDGSPTWTVLPSLPTLVEALPGDLHPATIGGFMTTPQRGLRIDGANVSPAAWLRSGGDVDEVLRLLDGYLAS